MVVTQQKETICDPENVDKKLCKQEELGAFILSENATEKSINPIISKAVHLKDPSPIKYDVRRTGYYCVATYSDSDYKGVVEFRNSYGELPAAQIAKLPFYGGLTIVYAVIGVYVISPQTQTPGDILRMSSFWGFLYFQNRHDIRQFSR